MKTSMPWIRRTVWTTVVLLGLSACGGSSDAPVPAGKLYVVGDSLADVGTFGGLKFTVVDPAALQAAAVFPQQVAARAGMTTAQCNFYLFNNVTFVPNPQAGCTNYAIGGARVIYSSLAADPRNVTTQLATRASQGDYAAKDLLLVDGGANDLADLVEAAAGGDTTRLSNQLAQLLTPVQIATGAPTAGGLYMQALADRLFDSVKSQALDKGASRVVVLNVPDITRTPRFAQALAGLPPGQGPALQAMVQGWAQAFNARLSSRASAYAAVAVVDFYGVFSNALSNPATFGLSNVTDPVCTNAQAFPCLSSDLDAQAGKTAGWWKTYAFSDSFHPTPAAHGILSDEIARVLRTKGWL